MAGFLGGGACRVVWAAARAFGRLPPPVGYACADLVAAIGYRLDRRRRNRALRNVAAALPELSEETRRRVVACSYRNLLRLAYDLTAARRLLSPATLPETVRCLGREHLESLRPQGGRAVYVTAHVGAWEILGLVMGLLGFPLTSVAREDPGRGLDRVLRRLREIHGQRILPARGVVARAREMARAGARIAFVADEHPRSARIWVPFFGRPAAWTKAPASLARRLGVPLQIGFARRLGRAFRFEVTFFPPCRPDPGRPARADVARLTAYYARCLEEYVRAHPEEYLWQQRRWRTPVDGEEYCAGETYVRHRTFGSHPAAAAVPRGAPQSRPPE